MTEEDILLASEGQRSLKQSDCSVTLNLDITPIYKARYTSLKWMAPASMQDRKVYVSQSEKLLSLFCDKRPLVNRTLKIIYK